jgi:hypothetical protein
VILLLACSVPGEGDSGGGGGCVLTNDNIGVGETAESIGDSETNENIGDGTVIIAETTRMLTDIDLQGLVSSSQDLSELVFDQDTETLAQMNPDDVIVCGVHGEEFPYGFLRKVTSIDRNDGRVTVKTVHAALTDAIQRGSLSETILLSPDEIVTRADALRAAGKASDSVTLQADGATGIVFAINDYELYDADGDESTREDRVWVDGNFSFVPTMTFEIDIDGFEIDTLTFEIGSDQQASIRVTAAREATFSETEVLETLELTPITFFIGPVPVVLVPRIEFRIGVDGTVTADLTAGVQADAAVRIGFGYQNGEWGPVSDFDPQADFDVPAFRDGAKGTARVWAGPRAELAAYGIAGVYGELRGFVRGEVDSTADPWWTLSAGVEALAGVFIEIFDETIAEYETDPFTATIDLANAGGPAPTDQTEVITWARSFAGRESDNLENPVAIIATPDGGSLVAGGSNSFTASPTDTWLLKLDSLGQVSWQRAFEDANAAIGVAAHPQGGYVVLTGSVGTSASDFYLIHIDENGDPVWSNIYEGEEPTGGYGLITNGDEFLIGGVYGGGIESDFFLASFDGTGQILWAKAIGGDQGEQIDGVALTDDGGIVAVGPTHSFGVSFNGHWVVRFDAEGSPVWQQSFDGNGNEWAHAIVPDADGNFKVLGRTGSDALVTKLNSNGELLSAATYDGGSPFEEAFSALGTDDGGLLIAGNTGLGDEADLWLMRLTPQLEVLWTTSYGGPGRDEAGGTIQYGATSTPMAMTGDGGFLVLSNSNSFGESFSDTWVQKVSGTGVVTYDAESSAQRLSLTGSFQDYEITRSATTASTIDVQISVTPVDLTPLTTDANIITQATP